MPITAEYDANAGAIYVRLTDGTVARTIEAMGFVIDVDERERPIGLEITGPRNAAQIGGVVERFGLLDRLGEIRQAIASELAPPTAYTARPIQMIVNTVQAQGSSMASGSISLGVSPRELQ